MEIEVLILLIAGTAIALIVSVYVIYPYTTIGQITEDWPNIPCDEKRELILNSTVKNDKLINRYIVECKK